MAADSYGPKGEPQFAGSGASADAEDLTLNGEYAALVGNRKVGTTTERNAATTASNPVEVWEGLEWEETNTGLLWKRRGGQWVRAQTQRGSTQLVSIAANGSTRIAHGLGFTPEFVLLSVGSHPTADPNSRLFRPVWWNPTTVNGTDFAVRLVDERTNDWAADAQQVRLVWLAGAN